jgi:membrane protein required for colicin V production
VPAQHTFARFTGEFWAHENRRLTAICSLGPDKTANRLPALTGRGFSDRPVHSKGRLCMNLLDLGIIVLLGLITVRGFFRGLFQEVAVLVGVVGGVVVAAHTYLRLAGLLQPWITDPQYARWVAFAVVFLAVYWLTRLAAHFIQRLLYHLYLDFFDRLLGGAFALAKGALLIGFGLMLLGVVMPRNSHLLKGSVAAPQLISLARQSLGLLPPDFKQRMQDYLKEWRRPRDVRQAEASRPQADPALLAPAAAWPNLGKRPRA